MNVIFYIAAAVAVISTLLAVTRLNAVHALLYMITSLLSVSLIFFVLGAPYVAALMTIVYAGAIMVLFIFVIMMLNQGPQATRQEAIWLQPSGWIGPSILALILLLELLLILQGDGTWLPGKRVVEPQEVGIELFARYSLVIELSSLLLLAGLIGAYHIGRREPDYQGSSR
jgi:NADH-quinone oxidoreductase subunit J